MKTRVQLFKLTIQGGYLADVKPNVRDIFEEYPAHRSDGSGWNFAYYPPKQWLPGEENRNDSWREAVKENPGQYAQEYPYWETFEIEVQSDKLLALIADKVEHIVRETRWVDIDYEIPRDESGINFMNQLIALNDKVIEQLGRASELQFNSVTNSMQPGSVLPHINCVKLCEDSCTDNIQNYLEDGWRILAIQPQPDQRRPDYILGKFDPTYVAQGRGATRG